MRNYKQGEIVILDFDPQAGHEQKGRRPAIVVSNDVFNKYSSVTLVCPITHTANNNPFRVELGGASNIDGYVMCDQVRALDLTARNASFVEHAPKDVITEVVDVITAMIERGAGR